MCHNNVDCGQNGVQILSDVRKLREINCCLNVAWNLVDLISVDISFHWKASPMSIAMSCEELTIVIVDDETEHRNLIRATLEQDTDSCRAVNVVEYEEPDVALVNLPPNGNVVILVDYNLNGASGLDWIHDFSRAAMGPVIIVTSSGDEEIAAKAFRMGAMDYLDKGDIIRDPVELWASINRSQRRFKLERTNKELSRSLKVANAELTAKNDRLAVLTENAQQFVEDVAHEFRTPLTVIKEFASIMADGIGGEVTPKQVGFLDFISEATSDLANLVDDFLDCGKLRTGMLRVDRQKHDPQEIVDLAWRMIETRAAAKSITIEKILPSKLPQVYCDAEKAGRALLNLVTNAIKFTNPSGCIRIRLVPVSTGVRYEVVDEGPGLTQTEIEHLFERFSQTEGAHKISEKGFGLGLSIVRDLVQINLGAVQIWSAPGEGSVFSFTVPTFETESILGAYMERARQCDSGTPVTALSVVRKHSNPDIDSDQQFLSSVCYGTDLVIRLPETERVLIIGQTSKSTNWIKRLGRADEARHADGSGRGTDPLIIEVVGMWRPDEALDEVCNTIKRCAKGGEHG